MRVRFYLLICSYMLAGLTLLAINSVINGEGNNAMAAQFYKLPYKHSREILNWQLHHGQGNKGSVGIRFRVYSNAQNAALNSYGNSDDQRIRILAKQGQSLVGCGALADTDNIQILDDSGLYSHFILIAHQAVLRFSKAWQCPEWLSEHFPFHSLPFLRSDESFLTLYDDSLETEDENHTTQSLTPFHEKKDNTLRLSGGSSGYDDGLDDGLDDDNGHRRPPFIPPLFLNDYTLTLLPAPAMPQWLLKPMLSRWQYLFREKTDDTISITVILQVNGHPSLYHSLWLNQDDYQELIELLATDSIRQLIYWLASRPEAEDDFSDQWLEWSNQHEVTGYYAHEHDTGQHQAIKQILLPLAKRPELSFRIEIMNDSSPDTLSESLPENNGPPIQSAVIETPGGETTNANNNQNKQPAGRDTPIRKPATRAVFGQAVPQGNNGFEQPDIPLPPVARSVPVITDAFVLEISGQRYLVQKQHLSPNKKGSEDPATIWVESIGIDSTSDRTGLSRDATMFPLSELEQKAGVRREHRLPLNEKTIAYLLHYGTDKTRQEVMDFYGVATCSYQQKHFLIDRQTGKVNSSECPVCLTSLLDEDTLIRPRCCNTLFHPHCLANALAMRGSSPSCPTCRAARTAPAARLHIAHKLPAQAKPKCH